MISEDPSMLQHLKFKTKLRRNETIDFKVSSLGRNGLDIYNKSRSFSLILRFDKTYVAVLVSRELKVHDCSSLLRPKQNHTSNSQSLITVYEVDQSVASKLGLASQQFAGNNLFVGPNATLIEGRKLAIATE